MAQTQASKSRRRTLQNWIASGAILAVVATIAVVANGFDAQETPREDPSVWVARSSGQYARVNTETAEIDTVRLVDNPSAVVQSGGLNLLLTQGYGRAWMIDPTAPQDVQDERGAGQGAGPDQSPDTADVPAVPADPSDGGSTDTSLRTPDGTRQVLSGGGKILFHTEAGDAYLADVVPAIGSGTHELGAMQLLDPLAEDRAEAPEKNGEQSAQRSYFVAATAIDANGLVALYAPAEGGVRWFDSVTGTFIGGVSSVPDDVPDEGVELAIVDGSWVLFNSASGDLWREAGQHAELDLNGVARLQGSAIGAEHTDVYVADESGLWRIAPGKDPERVAEAEGTPARPQQAGTLIAAWVSTSSAAMWTLADGLSSLDFDDSVQSLSIVTPEIRVNGTRALLAETQSGMMWTVPGGTLIPVEQWMLIDPPKQQAGEIVAQDVTEQEPPVAVEDTFGVRAGEPVLLQVLLNDFDPNRRDVLTVVPDSLGEGVPSDFGILNALSDGQGLTIHPNTTATGVASFSYRITDGVNVSEPATVTLTVIDESVNSAPEWCPVAGCQRMWPSPELAPGGTLVLAILDGWVDPEGDPTLLTSASAVDATAPVRVLVTADGRLAVRHTDPNAPDADVSITVRIEDTKGAATERDLIVRVRSGAALDFPSIASTVKTGETTTLRPLERVTGGSGSIQLVDAIVQQGSIDAVSNLAAGTVDVTAGAPGSSIIAVTVRDNVTGQEASSFIRVTAVESRGAFAVPPLRAFVRPMADTTIDVLASIPGANTRALTVQSATVNDGQLRVDVIEHSSIRVSGSTVDGQPGRIGAIDVVITEGETSVTGRVTVFQVAESGGGGAIAVADTATVRVGSVVDIAVLENDVAPPGERLVLNPQVGSPGTDGELAFASGSRVRYLAPNTPGTYTLTYTTYGASSPEKSDVGHVTVTVLAEGSNRAPQPRTLTVRLAPGESVNTSVPLSGVDPDGDRVRLVSVGAPEDPQLSTVVQSRSSVISVTASSSATRGTQLVQYTVRDAFGGEGFGTLRIIVTEPDAGGGAPVVYSDYVRIARGFSEPATLRPLDNDLDPAGGNLDLISVEPNVPGGSQSAMYRQLEARLDLSRMDEGVVRITGGEDIGTFSYKYTVQSTKSTSTTDGLIVVQVSERIGLQAPTITDTILSVRDRSEFARNGVDVVSGHVRWAAGDIDSLKLSLWGSAAENYTVEGSKILGTYRADGDLVPFKLSGLDASGAQIESYGFLIIPPLDELRLNLKAGFAPITVKEGEDVSVNVNDIVELGSDDAIEMEPGTLQTQRAQASCATTSPTALSYSAGREAPWSDSCTIRVRLVEQNTYTVLSIPINIIPDAPVVQLNPLTRTIPPGQTQTLELTDMVAWQGGREGDVSSLVWQLAQIGGSFEVTTSGSTVQVTARADAVPGAQQIANVSVSGAGQSQAALTLRVGEAAPDTPQGATVALQCTVGSACSATLVDRSGEYDPFAGKSGSGLHVVAVDSGSCTYGTLQASGDSVSVSWPDSRGPGGLCTATFTVRDAQNRTGTGTIAFDALGVPRSPASIRQIGYGASSVRLEVALGDAANAHPSTTGVVIDMDGSRVNAACSPSGGTYQCEVSGLEVGVSHTFTARAVNQVGDSNSTTNSVTAWAYRVPAAPQVAAKQVSAETSTSGTLKLEMTPGDATTGGYQVTAGGQTQTVSLGQAAEFSGLTVGPVSWQVIPVSNIAIPDGGSANGDIASGAFNLAGRPVVQLSATPTPNSNDVQITITVTGNGGSNVSYGYDTANGLFGNLQCDVRQYSNAEGTHGHVATGERYRWMRIAACAQNEWGPSEIVSAQARVYGNITPPQVNSGFTVNTTPTAAGEYLLAAAPTVTPAATFTLEYQVQGMTYSDFPTSLDPNQLAAAQVRQCADGECSAWEGIAGNVPTTVKVSVPACVDPTNLGAVRNSISTPARGTGTAAIGYDETTKTLTITWLGSFAPLAPYSAVVANCNPPPPNPDPGTPPGGGG